MSSYSVLVVDDEPANLESLERILKSDGGQVFLSRDPREALDVLRSQRVDIVLTDLRMDSMNGMELLQAIKIVDPQLEVVLMTAYGTVEVAVEAMKKGAYDFITKPLQRIQVIKVIHRALEKRRLVNENLALKEELKSHLTQERESIVGKSQSVIQVMEIALQAARSRANVLIEGESGTGKGVLAEFLHQNSAPNSAQNNAQSYAQNYAQNYDRGQGLFVKINCTAIPETLLEAELFGYEPGAFTGATKRKKGRVELAQDGTLFLDEIGIAPLTLQSKLLRFLQDGEFERLGSNETLHVSTRVVSATNVDLKRAISNGQFREDLYYRLNVIHIRVPSLRERLEDIPLLAQRFLEESAKKNGRSVPLIDPDALDCLCGYSWPGNIRELQNLMERVVVLNRTGVVTTTDLPVEVGGSPRPRSLMIPLGLSLRDVERKLMEETLRSTRGDKRLAAKLLGIHPRTIYRYLETSVRDTERLPSDFKEGEPAEIEV